MSKKTGQIQPSVQKKKQEKSGGSSKPVGKSNKRPAATQKVTSTQSKSQKSSAHNEGEDEFDSQIRSVRICVLFGWPATVSDERFFACADSLVYDDDTMLGVQVDFSSR